MGIGGAGQCQDLTPRIGSIEIYGVHKASLEKIKAAIGAKPGDRPPARPDLEERVNKVPGVVVSRAEASCCLEKRMILYVGVEDPDGPHLDYHPQPQGTEALAQDIL